MEYFAYFGMFVTAIIVILFVNATISNYRDEQRRKRGELSEADKFILRMWRRD